MSVSRFRLRCRGFDTGSDNPQPPEKRQPFPGECFKIPDHAFLERVRVRDRLTLVGQRFAGFVMEVPHPVHRALQPRRVNGKNDRSYDVGNFQAVSRNARCQMEGFSLQDAFSSTPRPVAEISVGAKLTSSGSGISSSPPVPRFVPAGALAGLLEEIETPEVSPAGSTLSGLRSASPESGAAELAPSALSSYCFEDDRACASSSSDAPPELSAGVEAPSACAPRSACVSALPCPGRLPESSP